MAFIIYDTGKKFIQHNQNRYIHKSTMLHITYNKQKYIRSTTKKTKHCFINNADTNSDILRSRPKLAIFGHHRHITCYSITTTVHAVVNAWIK